MNNLQQSDYDQNYRYPILHSDSLCQVHSLDEMQKKMTRGTYICSECFSMTGDLKKSAVMLKGGSVKVRKHASHYADKACGNDNPLHKCMKIAYATYTNGVVEKKYPDSNFVADAGANGADDFYYEFENTSLMSVEKQKYIKEFTAKGNVVYILSLTTEKIKAIIPTLWRARLESEDWCTYWYQQTYPLLVKYSQKYKGANKGATKMQANGTADVTHFPVRHCDIACEHFLQRKGANGQTTFFADCALSKKLDMPIINSRCIFGLGKNYE